MTREKAAAERMGIPAKAKEKKMSPAIMKNVSYKLYAANISKNSTM